MDVSIIIVNYNTCQMTKECIDSIFSYTEGVLFEVILVDNGSIDESKNTFSKDSRIKYIFSDANLGFGKANNLGAEYATGEFLFLLNSDTLLIENSLKIFCDFFHKYNNRLNIGVLGCQLIDKNGVSNGYGSDFPTPQKEGKFLLKKIFRQKIHNYHRNENDLYQNVDNHKLINVEYVIGADMFLLRSVFEMVHGFDENFFMYFEESDLQMRISLLPQRYKNYVLMENRIIHLEGKSTEIATKTSKILTVNKSLFYYLRKHHSPINIVIFSFIHFIHSFLGLFSTKYPFKERIYRLKHNLYFYFNHGN